MRLVYTFRYMIPKGEPGKLTEPERDVLYAKAIVQRMIEAGKHCDPYWWEDRPAECPDVPLVVALFAWLFCAFGLAVLAVADALSWLNHHPGWLIWLALAALGVVGVAAGTLWIGWRQ